MKYLSVFLVSMLHVSSHAIGLDNSGDQKNRYLTYSAAALRNEQLSPEDRTKIFNFVCEEGFENNDSAHWFALSQYGITSGDEEVMYKSAERFMQSDFDCAHEKRQIVKDEKSNGRLALETASYAVATSVTLILMKYITQK